MTKREVMETILEYWEYNPHFRFCQFMECIRGTQDIFYWTDQYLIDRMKEYTVRNLKVGC